MINKKQAIGLMFITIIFVAIIGITCEQKINAGDRAAEGMVGGAITGAAIGGLAGGGKGAAVGAAFGGFTGYGIGRAADEDAYYRNRYYDDYDYPRRRYYRPRRVIRVEEDYYPNYYYSRRYLD